MLFFHTRSKTGTGVSAFGWKYSYYSRYSIGSFRVRSTNSVIHAQ